MKKLSFILTAVFALIGVGAFAQEEVVYNQYHFNYYLINPAVAGADKCSHLMLTTKNNWIGLEGTGTQALSFRSRLTDKNIGLGGYVYNTGTPNFRNTGAQFTFAYHIPMSDGARYLRDVKLDRQLSFGVSARLRQTAYTARFGDSNVQNDPANVSDSEWIPDANVGVYYVDYGWFAGLSVANLIPFKSRMLGRQEPQFVPTAFLFVGKSFYLTDDKRLEPSINFNYGFNNNKQLEVNLKYTQNNQIDNYGFWAQLSYRHNFDAAAGQPISLIPMAGVRIQKFQLGYAFNLTLNELMGYNYGSHEVMLAYTFCIPKEFCR